ncbi:MAG: DNA gyrase inhibitor YacG [Pseudomonadota bacterium]
MIKSFDNTSVKTVNCPTCNTAVVWAASSMFKPFCSERCRLIDLGQWQDEEHRISDKENDVDVSAIDIEDIEALLAKQQEDFFKQ